MTVLNYLNLPEFESRNDAISGGRKSGRNNSSSDPVASQRFKREHRIPQEELFSLHDSNWLYERIIDDFSNYCTKEGAEITIRQGADVLDSTEDEGELSDFIERHGVYKLISDMVAEERSTGDAAVLPVTNMPGNRGWDQELADRYEIKTFNVIGQDYITDFDIFLNPLSSKYKEIDKLHVQQGRGDDNQQKPIAIHHSRFYHLRTRWSKHEPRFGLSVWERLYDVARSLANADWVVGQILFRAIFKVLKTDLGELNNEQSVKSFQNMMEQELDALSLSVIDKEDDLEMKGAGAASAGLASVIEFLKDLVSASTGIPRSIMWGQQSGQVAGADRDAKNYFSSIAAFQQRELTPALKWIIRRGIEAKEINVKPDAIIDVEWNPIFGLSEKEQADTMLQEQRAKESVVNQAVNLVQSGLVSLQQAEGILAENEIVEDDETPAEKAASNIDFGFNPTPL